MNLKLHSINYIIFLINTLLPFFVIFSCGSQNPAQVKIEGGIIQGTIENGLLDQIAGLKWIGYAPN